MTKLSFVLKIQVFGAGEGDNNNALEEVIW